MRNMKNMNVKRQIRRAAAVGLLAAFFAVTGCANGKQAGNANQSESTSTTPFPEFTTVDLEGNTVDESFFGNKKLTMVNVWGTFCSPCIQEMPDLGELAEEYEENLQILGIVSDVIQTDERITEDTLEEAKRLVEVTKAEYIHVVTSESLLDGFVSGISAVPTTFFVNKDGNVLGVGISGARTKEKWQEIIEALLEQQAD